MSQRGKTKTVLLIPAENPASIPVLEPVAKELESRGYRTVFLSAQRLFPLGINEAFRKAGLNYVEIEVGKPIAQRRRLRYLRVYNQVRLWAKQLMRRLKPAAVVTLKSTGIPALFVLAAKERKAPVLLVQEAFIGEMTLPEFHVLFSLRGLSFALRYALKRFAALFPPPFDVVKFFAYRPGLVPCDMVAVAGEQWIETYARYGIPRRKIAVTGWPGYRRFFDSTQIPPDRSALPPEIQNLTDRNIVLFTQQPLREAGGDEDVMYRNLVDACSSLDGVELVIKVHPRDTVEHVKSRIEAMGLGDRRYTVFKGGSVDQILPFCKALVTVGSTTCANALIHGVPVIVIGYADVFFNLRAIEGPALTRIDRPQDTGKIIREVVFNEEVRKNLIQRGEAFLDKLFYKRDGMSAHRIVTLVDQLTTMPRLTIRHPTTNSTAL